MAQWDNSAHHARQARKNTVLPAQMSKGGDKGPYVSEVAAGELYDMVGSDRGPLTPKEAGANTWHAIHAITPVADGTAVGTVPSLIRTPNDDLTQATGANQPLYRKNGQNGRPYLEFDGVNDELDSTLNGANTGSPPFAAFVLMIVGAQRTTPGTNDPWWCGNFAPKFINCNSSLQLTAGGDGTNFSSCFNKKKLTLGVPALVTVTCFGDGTGTLRINGEIDGAPNSLPGTFLMDLNVQNIGCTVNGATFGHFNFYETCFWFNLPPQSKIAAVEKYLLQTYGL